MSKTKIISISIGEDLDGTLESVAKITKRKKSDIIRSVLSKYLDAELNQESEFQRLLRIPNSITENKEVMYAWLLEKSKNLISE